jgi:hypothetical protein
MRGEEVWRGFFNSCDTGCVWGIQKVYKILSSATYGGEFFYNLIDSEAGKSGKYRYYRCATRGISALAAASNEPKIAPVARQTGAKLLLEIRISLMCGNDDNQKSSRRFSVVPVGNLNSEAMNNLDAWWRTI